MRKLEFSCTYFEAPPECAEVVRMAGEAGQGEGGQNVGGQIGSEKAAGLAAIKS